MGGADSEVGEGTTDVIVESAIFDPISIRRTAFRYALRSEASLRFEKGQEFRLARIGADRTARLIAEWAGGEVAPGVDRFEPDRAAARARRLPAGPGQPAAGHGLRARRAASAPRPGRDRDGPGRTGTRIRVAARHQAARRRARRRRGGRCDRPDLAPRPRGRGRHHRGGRSASAATTSSRRPSRTRRCRPTATTRSRCATPSARRSPAPA